MPKEPIIRGPGTDLTGLLVTHQGTRCAGLEMKTMNCFEAYGHIRAIEKCRDIMDDYKECFLRQKQVSLLFSQFNFLLPCIKEVL
ncbi:hypothetical protein O3M35_003007 [Rhynocoris fuscipes]|uniref:NADH-ubiquinone oxidoreductase 15 kDa subunit n=1 Tax=Rhynocoris fuscipes TaxID=488301 RepID=A0AAW1CIK9_9HEMI